VAGSIWDWGRFQVLYAVRNAFARPSVNRVRFTAASYPNVVVIVEAAAEASP